MIRLEGTVRRQLIDFLVTLDCLESMEECRSILKNAGLSKLIPKISFAGSRHSMIGQIVDFLANWGSIEAQEALFLFLYSVQDEVGAEARDTLQSFINQLSSRRMLPPNVTAIKNDTPSGDVLEKLISEPSLLPVYFLEQALELARAVIYIAGPDRVGTGFMISPQLAITNHHVLSEQTRLQQTSFNFNYQQNRRGEIGPVESYHSRQNGLFFTCPELDYSIVELDQSPGEKWGYLTLAGSCKVHKDERLNIIQHPFGRPKQITIRNNFTEYVDERIAQYVTHTEPGSSGSPVFNDQWVLVALHHAGGNLREPATQRACYRNEGILIRAIHNSLPEQLKAMLS